jgi:integrase
MADDRQTRAHGLGGVYRRGARWWIYYQSRDGQKREPGGFDGRGALTKDEATRKLRQRVAEIETGRYVGPAGDRLTVDSLLDDYLEHLETKGARGIAQARSNLSPLRGLFGADRAMDVTSTRLREYIATRQTAGSAPATINRGLQSLRAAFNLARREDRLVRVPYFPMLREDNARTGFFERAEHEAIKAKLPDPHRDVAEFGYRSGWRLGEILPLEWANVDLSRGTVTIRTSKNGDPRTFPLRDETGQVTEAGRMLKRRWKARVYTPHESASAAVSSFVFHVQGHRVWDFGRVWRKAREAAELPGKLFHDYRRTAARDLVRAGVPESVAMEITGHRTRSVFERYNITSERDTRIAVGRLSGYRAEQPRRRNVQRMRGA